MRALDVYLRFDRHCVYCGGVTFLRPIEEAGNAAATRDHRVPRSRGGSGQRTNLALACNGCNGAKGDMTEVEFRHFLATGRFLQSYVSYLEARARWRRQRSAARGVPQAAE